MAARSEAVRERCSKPKELRFSSVNAPLLQLGGIIKSFGAARALRGVSFELRAGEVHALISARRPPPHSE